MLKPFLNWTGGKKKLLPDLNKLKPENFNHYFEPFLGGGAFLFNLSPKNATVSDFNADLINTYCVVRDNIEELIELLKVHQENNEKDIPIFESKDKSSHYYYKVRAQEPTDKIERAARFIYLNKMCFNALYRVNKKNKFNVPIGSSNNPTIFDEDNLREVHTYLNENNIKILHRSFENIKNEVQKGDFVYFDPPYVPINKTSNFTSYTSDGFTYENQVELRDLFKELSDIGVYCMLSNSYTDIILDLYKDFNIHTVSVQRLQSAKASSRGKVKEVIITNY